MLMKSTLPPHVTTWQQFVDYNFTAKLTSLHGAYKNVILSFDNYECVPVGALVHPPGLFPISPRRKTGVQKHRAAQAEHAEPEAV